MKPLGNQLHLNKNGTVSIHGIDYGGKLSLVEENSEAVVIKVHGHTGWSGRGQTKYFSPEILVFKVKDVVSDNDGNRVLFVQGLITLSLARKK